MDGEGSSEDGVEEMMKESAHGGRENQEHEGPSKEMHRPDSISAGCC
jgi:hypothetical protein